MKLLKAEAGVNDGKAGLLSAAGLFAKGGIFDKKSESFNIQELDPYLLFDARSSMLGTLENPTLDLDPATPSTLDVITATRAGIATYTDPDGNIATASADTVRVDYVDSVPMILVEPSATNLLPYSEDFSNAAWDKNNVTLTADYGIAPDGTNTSTRIEYSGTSYIQDSFAVSDYTVSAFVKGVAGQVVRFGVGVNVAGGADFTLNGEWQRIEYTGSGGTIFFSTFGGNTATDFEIWGAQVETGSVATSYIPTSGGDAAARTRAADDLVISGSAFTDFYNQSEGTAYVENIEAQNSVDSFVLDASNGFANYIDIFNTGSDTKVVLKSGGTPYVNKVIGNRPSKGVLSRVAISYKTNNVSASIDGVNMSPDTSATMPTTINKLILGADFNSANQLNGHIKRLIYWPYHSDSL